MPGRSHQAPSRRAPLNSPRLSYLNRIASSRRLEREAARNVELMWLIGRLAPDHKTIADFRRDNGPAIKRVSGQFVLLCRRLGLFGDAVIAIDGSKFKAVNNRNQNFTSAKMQRRLAEIEAAIARYMAELDGADAEPGSEERVEHLEQRLRILCARAPKEEFSPFLIQDPE